MWTEECAGDPSHQYHSHDDDGECGSCGAFIDLELAEEGDLYHHPDDDCRAVRVIVRKRDLTRVV